MFFFIYIIWYSIDVICLIQKFYTRLTQVKFFWLSYCKFQINIFPVKYEFIFLSTSLHLIFTYFLFFMNSYLNLKHVEEEKKIIKHMHEWIG